MGDMSRWLLWLCKELEKQLPKSADSSFPKLRETLKNPSSSIELFGLFTLYDSLVRDYRRREVENPATGELVRFWYKYRLTYLTIIAEVVVKEEDLDLTNNLRDVTSILAAEDPGNILASLLVSQKNLLFYEVEILAKSVVK